MSTFHIVVIEVLGPTSALEDSPVIACSIKRMIYLEQ